MSCEGGEILRKAGEATGGVNTYRAARQLERFMMSVNPNFRLGVSDLGDEHLTVEELSGRKEQERSQRGESRIDGEEDCQQNINLNNK